MWRGKSFSAETRSEAISLSVIVDQSHGNDTRVGNDQ